MNASERWKLAVLEADDWTCQQCGTVKHLDAHHILARSQRPDLATDPTNGVTLCRRCHDWFHEMPQQFEAFLARWRRGNHTSLLTLIHSEEIPRMPPDEHGGNKRFNRDNRRRNSRPTDEWVRQQNSR